MDNFENIEEKKPATKKPVVYPSPRYTVAECLVLLKECNETFYAKVRSGRYKTISDGRRRYMTHPQLLDAAEGDSAQGAAQ